ncbi:cell wall-binding repeat-containing protein [Paenisporosarcina antarctica]|uniref:SpoIID/LytB domain-containing protein n=1 Tax=Paenisporosarcina antarctica TaxID=417367 RepID=A0A4P6ZYJ6_9BACL|nr:cell wall-binding repeat-containing protein [Paenisporosarcina antarctica]QBP41770.1 SpoIID/LytB domain-containing protein [Paenisporosarcina antarctica]
MSNLLLKWILSITLIFTILHIFNFSTPVYAASDTENFIVKVKLTNNLGPSKTYQFIPKGDTVLKEDTNIVLKKDMTYKLAIQNSKIALYEGSKLLKNNLTILTLEPKVYANENFVLLENMKSTIKRPHIGTIIFGLTTISNSQYLQPINHLGFEDYLKGVLPGEMPASWGTTGGQQALRAQAVAARSYIFAKMNGNSQLEIDDTINFQVYQGFVWDAEHSPNYVSANQYTTSAVDSTKGMIMTYQKSNGSKGFVTAFFSASNGGQTELPQQYWSSGLPYINTSQNDPYDQYKWTAPLQFKKQQLTITDDIDFTNPASWWSTTSENNYLLENAPKSVTAFSKFKLQALKEAKAIDATIESIKIDSINSINTTEYTNTGKVQDITFNLSYFARNTNLDNSLYYSMELGAQSETLAGVSRYDTAVEIARRGWTGKRDHAVLGRGDLPVDALAGSVLAYKLDTPVLLTRTSSLPASVKDYLKETLNPGATVYILGGTIAISPAVETELKQMGYKFKRVAGKSRTDTSLEIAKIVGGTTNSVFFATGNEKSSDALSISPYAARNQMPIIIQQGTKLSQATADYLKSSGTTTANLIGGADVVSSGVETTLKKAGYATDRTFGTSRVDTSIAINKKFVMPGDSLAIGNAYSFVDALAGSVLSAKKNSPILLLHPDPNKLPVEYLDTVKQPKTLFYLGGESVVSKDMKYSLSKYIGGTLKKFTTEFKLTGPQLRYLLGGTVLMSTDFKVKNDTVNKEFSLNGTGYGHGIGMSQYGAYGRSKAGKTAEEILEFYYQGISIEQAKDYIK